MVLALIILGVVYVILAGVVFWLWGEKLDELRAGMAEFDELRAGMAEFERRFEAHGLQLNEIHNLIARVDSLTQSGLTGGAKIHSELSHVIENLDARLDAVEAKLDITKSRQRLRAPFSQLRGQVRQEPWRPEPSRYDEKGNELPA